MDKKELELALAELKTKLEEANTNKAKELIQAEMKALEAKLDEFKTIKDTLNQTNETIKTLNDTIKVIKDEADKDRKALNNLLVNSKHATLQTGGKKSFGAAFSEAAQEAMDQIKKGQPFTMDVKDVGDMTMTTSVGGIDEGFPTLNPTPIIKPGQKMRFRDLVRTYPTATGLYWQYSEGDTTGQIDAQVEGQPKPKLTYQFDKNIYTVDFVSGYARVSRQLLQDLPFVQNVLPQLLLRDFQKRENAMFYASLLAAIPTASTAATNNAEQIIDVVAELEEADFEPNGTVMRPTNYANMYKYKGSGSGDYTYPGVLQINRDGSMSMNGVNLYKATWVDPTTAITGDWDYAKIIQASNLEVRFFEQDGNNVRENMVTVRIEARQGLAIDLAEAFRKFTLAV